MLSVNLSLIGLIPFPVFGSIVFQYNVSPSEGPQIWVSFGRFWVRSVSLVIIMNNNIITFLFPYGCFCIVILVASYVDLYIVEAEIVLSLFLFL